jgi:hypothetical protein
VKALVLNKVVNDQEDGRAAGRKRNDGISNDSDIRLCFDLIIAERVCRTVTMMTAFDKRLAAKSRELPYIHDRLPKKRSNAHQ